MKPDPTELEGKVDELSRRLTAIEARLAALERTGVSTAAAHTESVSQAETDLAASRPPG